MSTKLKIGVSSCLLGSPVRFDGGHKRNAFICDGLAQFVEYVPFCPEMAIGLGTPRPALRLIGDQHKPRLVLSQDDTVDHTKAMQQVAKKQSQQLEQIVGYIFKNKSPSCGLKRVKVYKEKHKSPAQGVGIYAKVITDRFPLLPVEEEGRLQDPLLRENFIERIYVYHDWLRLNDTPLTKKKLIDFHSRYKLSVMAHHLESYKALGRLLSDLKGHSLKQIAQDYITLLMKAFTYIATSRKQSNVLLHCLGYFKQHISSDDKQELIDAINNYRISKLPLIVPITLIKHHLRHSPNAYLLEQRYLSPYPEELMLRNKI